MVLIRGNANVKFSSIVRASAIEIHLHVLKWSSTGNIGYNHSISVTIYTIICKTFDY